MNIVYSLALATAIVFSQSLHAQSCSGGIDGGMDATGNQCNAPVSVMAYTTESAAARPVELAHAGDERPAHAMPAITR